MPARRLIITGKVQGVFYRVNAKKEADVLGLKGAVQNLPGGSVEIYIEGDTEGLDMFINWCKTGPEHAEVASVSIKEVPEEHAVSFDIIGG